MILFYLFYHVVFKLETLQHQTADLLLFDRDEKAITVSGYWLKLLTVTAERLSKIWKQPPVGGYKPATPSFSFFFSSLFVVGQSPIIPKKIANFT
jgi:hypothetical protein